MQKKKPYQNPNNLMTQEMGTFCQKLVPLSTLLAKNIIELMISLLKVQFFATNGSDQDILKHYPRKFKNS